MSILISTERLQLEMARRAWNNSDLARAAGVSPATITHARAGKPVSPRTLGAIAQALAGVPPMADIDSLLL